MAEEAVPQLEEDPGLTRFEEAKICPKCGKPGEVRKEEPAPPSAGLKPGTKLVTVYCTTGGKNHPIDCPWYNTAIRLIQVNPDGTVPPPRNHTFSQKTYVAAQDADDIIRRINESMSFQQTLETQQDGHGEIRR